MKRLLGGLALVLAALVTWLAWPEQATTPPSLAPRSAGDPLTPARPPAVERAPDSPAGASDVQALSAGSRVAERAPDGAITLQLAATAPPPAAAMASEAPPPSGPLVAERAPDGTVTVHASPAAEARTALRSMRATATLQPDGGVRLERESF